MKVQHKRSVAAAVLVAAVGLGSAAVGAAQGGPANGATAAGQAIDDRTPTERNARPEPPVMKPAQPAADRPAKAEEAIAKAMGNKAEVKRSDRSEAKLTTWGELRKPGGPMSDVITPPVGFVDTQKVWVVAIGGELQPAFARGQKFASGVIVYDHETGVPLASFAGKDAWPPYFAELRPAD